MHKLRDCKFLMRRVGLEIFIYRKKYCGGPPPCFSKKIHGPSFYTIKKSDNPLPHNPNRLFLRRIVKNLHLRKVSSAYHSENFVTTFIAKNCSVILRKVKAMHVDIVDVP